MAVARERARFIGRRIAQAIPTIVVIATLNFLLVHLAPGNAAEHSIDDADHGVEVPARHRAHHQDDRVQPGSGCRGVFEELEADVPGAQRLCGDSRTHDERRQEGAADELGKHANGEKRPRARRAPAFESGHVLQYNIDICHLN